MYEPGTGPHPPRVTPGIRGPSQKTMDPGDWGFYTVRGGVDPGAIGVCPRDVGVVEIWNDV